MAHLWAADKPPIAYVELNLCRELGCLPSELRKERLTDILQILTCLEAEAKVAKKKSESQRRARK